MHTQLTGAKTRQDKTRHWSRGRSTHLSMEIRENESSTALHCTARLPPRDNNSSNNNNNNKRNTIKQKPLTVVLSPVRPSIRPYAVSGLFRPQKWSFFSLLFLCLFVSWWDEMSRQQQVWQSVSQAGSKGSGPYLVKSTWRATRPDL